MTLITGTHGRGNVEYRVGSVASALPYWRSYALPSVIAQQPKSMMPIQRSTARVDLQPAVNQGTLSPKRVSGDRWKEIAVKVPGKQAYNEEAFRYFLEIERKRSEASGRPFLLLLVDLVSQSGFDAAPGIDHTTADRVLSALALSLRETDFVGWYREGRAIGAVLSQHSETTGAGLSDVVAGRVTRSLDDRLPSHISPRLQVRVYQVPPSVASQG
jgi:hypothetical protein